MEQSRDGPEPPRVGTYRLDGETIWLQTPATTAVPAATWSVRIETLTEDKLRMIAEGQRTEKVRVKGKQ
jgi:hypothetical protein